MGFLLSRQEAPPAPGKAAQPALPPQAAIDRLLAAPFADLAGQPASLQRWQGKPRIVNFWATWCPPCLKELPAFSRLQLQHPEVQFVGIAADTPENVREFAAKNQLSYPILLSPDGGLSLMAELGNFRGGLPFTVGIDATGRPRHLRLGGVSETEAAAIIAELISR